MPGIGREIIYQSLFASLLALVPSPFLQGANWTAQAPVTSGAPFQFASRRYQMFTDIGTAAYPALMMIERGEEYTRSLEFGPANVTLIAHVIIQSIIGEDPNVISATELNNLADAVEGIVENYGQEARLGANQLPDASGNPQVYWAYVNGREVVQISTERGRYSEQTIEISLIATH